VDHVRYRGHAPGRSGGLPGGALAEPPFGSPPYGVPPSGALAASRRPPYPYRPACFVPPQRATRFGSPYPGTTPYPAARSHGAPPRGGRGLPLAVIVGLTALVLAGVVTLVVLICRATPGMVGERQVSTTRVDDAATDAQAQHDAVFAAIRLRPGTQIAT